MTKMREKVIKFQKGERGKLKKPVNMKPKVDPRAKILAKELKDFGKVGGFIDRRIGVQGTSSVTSTDAALRRHIIEKLRNMEKMGTTQASEDDPLIQAAMSGKKGKQKASFDDELGGLSADIVNSELFAGGLLTPADPTGERRTAAGTDVLLDKITATREERLKRVEENQEQRRKLKNADVDWSAKVRFMLSKLADLKPKNGKVAMKLEKGRYEVLSLLNKLNSVKMIAPTGTKIETEAVKSDKLLANLETIIMKRLESGEENAQAPDQPKTEDILIRVLCRMAPYEVATVTKLADDLRGGDPRLLADLPGAVRGLLLVHVLVELIQRKILPPSETTDGTNKFMFSDRLKGVFIPETVKYLADLLSTELLKPTKSQTKVCESIYSILDVRVALRQVEILKKDENMCRLSCLRRLFCLAEALLGIYSTNFPSPVVTRIFSGLSLALKTAKWLNLLPSAMTSQADSLLSSIDQVGSKPRPADIVTADKVSLLLADKNATSKAQMRLGIVPQLEPRFDEKLDARRTKKKISTRVELRQQLAREKRGAIREMRHDAQFLANCHLQKTKASDDMRKKKTQAIIASMRSID